MEKEKYIKQFKVDYHFRLTKKTLKGYILAVNQFLDHSNVPLAQISKRDIRNWLKYLMENGYGPSTINGKLAALKTFFKYCWEERIIQKNPAKDILSIKRNETLPRYLEHEQLARLRRLKDVTLKERAIIETLYATGVRISELMVMNKDDINWSERSIMIRKGKGKKERIVLFNQECAHYLKTYLASRTDDLPYVFLNVAETNRIYDKWIGTQFRSYSEKLGFKVAPHILRHTFAAHLAQKGMQLEGIQMLLGHEKHHTTHSYARLYEHARKELYDEWM
ncbi:tyrosine-type recombinase/integrase [Ureibacillus chungkukjangi]|uniref:Integrase/recombinase XerD n=1 Tax=Ureibacillus chungkukjangi TaxID=1202712 RepID=A0A318TUN2_9BACL|nr:tyrosine-type recombinase/integrase [Ureibacillus chungkukjangi]PYF07570.1 integrase/recombinase XerD [Ureibacillus chungkukjangi]